MDKSPCYGCELRNMGCHATCSKYKEWRAALDAEKPVQHDDMSGYIFARGDRLNRMQRSGTTRGNSSLFRNSRRRYM